MHNGYPLISIGSWLSDRRVCSYELLVFFEWPVPRNSTALRDSGWCRHDEGDVLQPKDNGSQVNLRAARVGVQLCVVRQWSFWIPYGGLASRKGIYASAASFSSMSLWLALASRSSP